VERALGILQKAAGVEREEAAEALKSAKNRVAVALVILKAGTSPTEAARRLKKARGNVRKAIDGI
jgi:N-acetylmuramic acid 6-phosphate (MurNAc-6-P) etherase